MCLEPASNRRLPKSLLGAPLVYAVQMKLQEEQSVLCASVAKQCPVQQNSWIWRRWSELCFHSEGYTETKVTKWSTWSAPWAIPLLDSNVILQLIQLTSINSMDFCGYSIDGISGIHTNDCNSFDGVRPRPPQRYRQPGSEKSSA